MTVRESQTLESVSLMWMVFSQQYRMVWKTLSWLISIVGRGTRTSVTDFVSPVYTAANDTRNKKQYGGT